tara:strand:- start:1854 stop:2285 length:432 start_codon:yes stop_codon:yes gene_type:complete
MAHFAQLDENNVVLAVNVIADADCLDGDGKESEAVGVAFCQSLFGGDTVWKQTSYNTSIGKRWKNDFAEEDTDKTQFRKNFAQPGYTYDAGKDAFIRIKDFPSWVLNETTCRYDAPVAYPIDEDGDEIPGYIWDEDNTRWVLP